MIFAKTYFLWTYHERAVKHVSRPIYLKGFNMLEVSKKAAYGDIILLLFT